MHVGFLPIDRFGFDTVRRQLPVVAKAKSYPLGAGLPLPELPPLPVAIHCGLFSPVELPHLPHGQQPAGSG
jgi:hypothetical protein